MHREGLLVFSLQLKLCAFAITDLVPRLAESCAAKIVCGCFKPTLLQDYRQLVCAGLCELPVPQELIKLTGVTGL